MSNIRIDVPYTITDGTELKFRSPVDCSQIVGLIVYYPGTDGSTTSKEFALSDAHGNNVGNIDHLFAEDVAVKVILDVTKGMAFVQNADTNAYLEGKLAEKAPGGYGYGGTAVVLQEDRVDDETELTNALEAVYSQMNGRHTKLVYWQGYPASGTSSHGWFGILTKSSANNGGIVAWSAYDEGLIIRKVKYSGTWQPLETMATTAYADTKAGKLKWLYTYGSLGLGHAERSITLETMHDYSWLMIVWKAHKDSQQYYRSFIPVYKNESMPSSQNLRIETIMGGGYYRNVSITDTGISVTTATKADDSGTATAYCILCQVWGFQ